MDGFHFEMFMLDKPIKNFQIYYDSFIFIIFISGKNTWNELNILWCAMDNKFFLD